MQSQCDWSEEGATVEPCDSSIQFLNFLVDVCDSGTGCVIPGRLAAWLGIPEDELIEATANSVAGSWPIFADQVIAVLDALHGSSGDLETTMKRFVRGHASFGASGIELVRCGQAGAWVRALRSGDSTSMARH